LSSHHHSTVLTKRAPLMLRPMVRPLLAFTLLLGGVVAPNPVLDLGKKCDLHSRGRDYNFHFDQRGRQPAPYGCEACNRYESPYEKASRLAGDKLKRTGRHPNLPTSSEVRQDARRPEYGLNRRYPHLTPKPEELAHDGKYYSMYRIQLENCITCNGTGQVSGGTWGTNKCTECDGRGNDSRLSPKSPNSSRVGHGVDHRTLPPKPRQAVYKSASDRRWEATGGTVVATSMMKGLDKIPLYQCKTCPGTGIVTGWFGGKSRCSECCRRRLEDDVNPLTALCAWALMLFIVALLYIVDRQMKMRKRDALQAGRFSRTATM